MIQMINDKCEWVVKLQDPPESDDGDDDNTNIDWTTVSEPDPSQPQAWTIEPYEAYGWEPE